eukprot:TRINITY_DN3529_c0_g1_i1.p1 TRINITY_DN3529_c0_g1~~TRINITY_DN3529_c0_g1_i1.p1  ORF type:complete len:1078 (+),score=170.13 TRINITY_DN3529_c0_g1_i1:343-3234(+)
MYSVVHRNSHEGKDIHNEWGSGGTTTLEVIAYVLVLLPGVTFGICWLMAICMERRVKATFAIFRGARNQNQFHRLDSQTPGEAPVCTILFSNLSYYTKPQSASLVRHVSPSMGDSAKQHEPVRVLNNVWGRVGPGKLIAIMGPSGAGKTTLLKLLGSRPGVQGSFSGTLLHYDRTPTAVLPPSWLEDHVGYVQQESSNVELHPQLTVRESLVYRALLKLPKTMSLEDKMKRVEAVIAEMGLRVCAENKLKNVSGGQKRRTHVAMHLLVLPSLLILDEPTSGLDSNTALELVKTLYILSRSQRTVILTIHQPRARILCLADRLAIMQTGGEMIYWGPPQILFDALADTNRPRTSLWSKARILMGNNVSDAACREIVSVFGALDTDRTGMVTKDKIEWWIKALQIRADSLLSQDPSSLAIEVLKAMGWMHGLGHITFFQFVNFVRDSGALGHTRTGTSAAPHHQPSSSYSEFMMRADTLTRPFRKKSALQASGGERAGRQFTVDLLRGVREWMNRKAHRWVKRIYDFEEEDEGSMVNPGDTIIDALRKSTNDLLLIPAITRMRASVLKEAAEAVQAVADSKQNKDTGGASSAQHAAASEAGRPASNRDTQAAPDSWQNRALLGRERFWLSVERLSSRVYSFWKNVYSFWKKMVVRIARFARSKGFVHIHSMVISSLISSMLLWSIFGYVKANSMWSASKFGMLLMIFIITTANIAFFQVTLVWVPEAKAQYEMEQADGVAHSAEISTMILLWDGWLSLICALTSGVFLFLSTNFVATADRMLLQLAVFALFSGCMQGIGTLLCIILGQTTATVTYGALIAANLLFTGFVVKLDNQPVWWKDWIHASYLTPSYHTMNAILQLRFRDQPMDCRTQDLPGTCYDGDAALRFLGYHDTPLSASVLALIILFVAMRVIVHIILPRHGQNRKTTLKRVEEEQDDPHGPTAIPKERPPRDHHYGHLPRHHTF